MRKFVFSLIGAVTVICSCKQSPQQRNEVELMVRQDGNSHRIHGALHLVQPTVLLVRNNVCQ